MLSVAEYHCCLRRGRYTSLRLEASPSGPDLGAGNSVEDYQGIAAMDDDTENLNILTIEFPDEALEAAAQTENDGWSGSHLRFSNIPFTTTPTLGTGCCSGIFQ